VYVSLYQSNLNGTCIQYVLIILNLLQGSIFNDRLTVMVGKVLFGTFLRSTWKKKSIRYKKYLFYLVIVIFNT
jgi:hypothetical protein